MRYVLCLKKHDIKLPFIMVIGWKLEWLQPMQKTPFMHMLYRVFTSYLLGAHLGVIFQFARFLFETNNNLSYYARCCFMSISFACRDTPKHQFKDIIYILNWFNSYKSYYICSQTLHYRIYKNENNWNFLYPYIGNSRVSRFLYPVMFNNSFVYFF